MSKISAGMYCSRFEAFAVCSASALLGVCKEIIHERCCHCPTTSEAFTANATTWLLYFESGDALITRDTLKRMQQQLQEN